MNAAPDWALYRTLLAVIDSGSLSGAARLLGLTQPTVARHVEALEAALGSDLFVRSQRGLAPTELALSLCPHAETMAATAAAILRTASGTAGEVAGTVRITASEVVGVEHLPPILARMRRDHPALTIELTLTDRVHDLVRGDADIAVRHTQPTQTALVARRIRPVPLGFHARRDYLDKRGTPVDLAALAEHDLIGFDTETPALRAMLAAFPGLERSGFALRTDSNLAQFAALRAGFGIGLCQIRLAQRDPALVRVLEMVTLQLPVWIAMHEDLRKTARCQTAFNTLVEALNDLDQG